MGIPIRDSNTLYHSNTWYLIPNTGYQVSGIWYPVLGIRYQVLVSGIRYWNQVLESYWIPEMPKSKEILNKRKNRLLDFGDRLLRRLTGGKSLTGGLIEQSGTFLFLFDGDGLVMASSITFLHSPAQLALYLHCILGAIVRHVFVEQQAPPFR